MMGTKRNTTQHRAILIPVAPGGYFMTEQLPQHPPELEGALWRLYRDFFDMAEKKRRWSIRDDIPWHQCNPALKPAIAHVVESFCAVELYLPDYTSKILPVVRPSRGRVWFYANWGYEESKHSLALADWLLKSGQRSDEQMADLERQVYERQWNLPRDSHLGMLAYAMVQEYATWLNYRNLRHRVDDCGGDPALSKLLMLVAVDEKAHYSFFRSCLELYLKYDRPAMLEQLRGVMNDFTMPAIDDLVDGRQRVAAVKALEIFNEDIYYREVYLPILEELGIDRSEMRNRVPQRKSALAASSSASGPR
jgi:acyl-[acyl-carrier-protein] desaturase